MENLKTFLYHELVNESESLNGWYADIYNDKYEMQGDILPLDISDILANGINIHPLDRNKKCDVYIVLKNQFYLFLFTFNVTSRELKMTWFTFSFLLDRTGLDFHRHSM